ncbi:MAG: hypothetical protein COX51_09250 [Syntrophobacteraceae bacterium CG23_combo_of_CG06-09_8_20_14_all_50_8]|nr:MAG: hypothetical protein COX51_09250 [Syntrophobacteraceae bacterium CG23_combo_of_CG06-09_8_20_14_all_50_8]
MSYQKNVLSKVIHWVKRKERRKSMPSKDIREFIALLEKKGHLQRISQEVDWNLEAGAISRRGCELKLPAILFEKLKDYPTGYRLLANPLLPFPG